MKQEIVAENIDSPLYGPEPPYDKIMPVLQMTIAVREAASVLRRGGLVAFPTETVYGLGADAENRKAVARLFAVKGRPIHHPVIVHIGKLEQLEQWAVDISETAWRLARRFWPGPLTLIFKRSSRAHDALTGGQDTVGLRIPDHPIARALLTEFDGGIAAPSANRFGRLSPTTAAHVHMELGSSIDATLDGGVCWVGIESTILDLSSGQPKLLRPGAISPADIEAELGLPLIETLSDAPRTPGSLAGHYAPQTPLVLVSTEDMESSIGAYIKNGERVAVLAYTVMALPMTCIWQRMPVDPVDYARELYMRLRVLDELQVDRILVEAPPHTASWCAVRDRLARAAQTR